MQNSRELVLHPVLPLYVYRLARWEVEQQEWTPTAEALMYYKQHLREVAPPEWFPNNSSSGGAHSRRLLSFLLKYLIRLQLRSQFGDLNQFKI